MDKGLMKINAMYCFIKDILKWNQHFVRLWLCGDKNTMTIILVGAPALVCPKANFHFHTSLLFHHQGKYQHSEIGIMSSYYCVISFELTFESISGTPSGPQIIFWDCSFLTWKDYNLKPYLMFIQGSVETIDESEVLCLYLHIVI